MGVESLQDLLHKHLKEVAIDEEGFERSGRSIMKPMKP